MLKYLLLFIATVTSEPCSFVYEQQRYERVSILTIKGLPTNLAVNPLTKDVFFTLIDVDSLHNDDEQTRMEQYVLRNGMPIKIDNVRGQAAAVDAKNNKVYIASDDGLNVLNKTDKANFVSLKDEDIVMLFKPEHNDELYAVFYPENELYTINLKKNEKRKVDNIPCAFVVAVDAQDNIYYECNAKYVKVLLKGFQESIEFVGIGRNSARAMTIDGGKRIILAANDGLYLLRPDNVIPKKLMDLDFVPSGITFDGDDMFIATNGVIYKYSADQCE
jgi:DNA-binding beta-propeller fold protein YncE